jgi:hypothetical protein
MRILGVVLAALALAGPAAAATPRLAVWDLQSDLAHASRNDFGDVAVKPRAALAGAGTLVRCGTWCRFGSGWLAFGAPPRLATPDLCGLRVVYEKRLGWTVQATLSPAAAARWSRFSRLLAQRSRRRGVPDVLVVAARGVVVASPLGSAVHAADGALVLTGFSRASAKALAAAAR